MTGNPANMWVLRRSPSLVVRGKIVLRRHSSTDKIQLGRSSRSRPYVCDVYGSAGFDQSLLQSIRVA